MPSSFHLWEVPGKPISIQLSHEAIDRILLHAVAGLGPMLKARGVEVGGILLGSSERLEGKLVVRIEDFEPVPCQHAYGPSYTLSEADKLELERALEKWKPAPDRRLYAVGYCRSNTREGMALSAEDMAVFSRHFPDPSHVALLVRPRATGSSAAGFFIREDGQIRSASTYLELLLEGRLGRPRPDVASAAAEAGVAAAGDRPAGEPPPGPAATDFALTLLDSAPRRHRRRWLWVVPVLAVLAAGAALLATGWVRLPLPAARRDPYALALAVRHYGDNVHLTWDRSAPAVRAAQRAVLIISDGDQTRALDLSRIQLHNGSVIYRRISPQVSFRLEVFFGNNTLSERWPAGPTGR
ncbi:MAG: hypothetical protein AAB225_11115 [Acidobacteriota bacterium]|mgnify:CR=1 FL=1